MCPGDTAECSAAHFREVSMNGWHIDGCASNFIPGTTDHFGVIHNFTTLVGCLLSDVEAPMGGELCVYPGSHESLALHFKSKGILDALAKRVTRCCLAAKPTPSSHAE